MPPSAPAAPASSTSGGNAPLALALRVFSLVVLVLMLVAIGYASWIAISNWGAIRV